MGNHHLIIIPGLSDNTGFIHWATRDWGKHGFIVNIHRFGWKGKESKFELRLADLEEKIIKIKQNKNDKLSLIGISAGGSAALNTYLKNKNKINNVVNVCGRLKTGKSFISPLNFASRNNPIFKKSVQNFEKREDELSLENRKKILTIRPLFDEIVPTSTVPIKEAKNIKILTVEHQLSIMVTFTLYKNKIINFLSESL